MFLVSEFCGAVSRGGPNEDLGARDTTPRTNSPVFLKKLDVFCFFLALKDSLASAIAHRVMAKIASKAQSVAFTIVNRMNFGHNSVRNCARAALPKLF